MNIDRLDKIPITENIGRSVINLYDEHDVSIHNLARRYHCPIKYINLILRGETFPEISSKYFDGQRLVRRSR